MSTMTFYVRSSVDGDLAIPPTLQPLVFWRLDESCAQERDGFKIISHSVIWAHTIMDLMLLARTNFPSLNIYRPWMFNMKMCIQYPVINRTFRTQFIAKEWWIRTIHTQIPFSPSLKMADSLVTSRVLRTTQIPCTISPCLLTTLNPSFPLKSTRQSCPRLLTTLTPI